MVRIIDKNNFAALIIKKGYSLSEFSKIIGKSRGYINTIINRGSLEAKTAKLIIKKLETEFDEIFFVNSDYKSNQTKVITLESEVK